MASIRPHVLTQPDPLDRADYEKLFCVLEDVVCATTPEQFRAQLPAALARHFGWLTARLLGGPTWELPDASSQFIRAMTGGGSVSRYTATPVDCTHLIAAPADHGLVALRGSSRFVTLAARITHARAGSLYVAVSFAEDRVGAREQEILCKLSRQLTALTRGHSAIDPVAGRRWALTRREHQVVELVAGGLTNEQIAERLYITRYTVKKHLTHSLSKARCTSRTQLAVRWQSSTERRRDGSPINTLDYQERELL